MRDQHGLSDWNVYHLRSEFYVLLENCGIAKHSVPIHMHPSHRVCEFPIQLFLYYTSINIRTLNVWYFMYRYRRVQSGYYRKTKTKKR